MEQHRRDGHADEMEEKSALLKTTISCRAWESFANIGTRELEIRTTKMDLFTKPKPLILTLLSNSSLFPTTSHHLSYPELTS